MIKQVFLISYSDSIHILTGKESAVGGYEHAYWMKIAVYIHNSVLFVSIINYVNKSDLLWPLIYADLKFDDTWLVSRQSFQ